MFSNILEFCHLEKTDVTVTVNILCHMGVSKLGWALGLHIKNAYSGDPPYTY